jgi:hypothetical protein
MILFIANVCRVEIEHKYKGLISVNILHFAFPILNVNWKVLYVGSVRSSSSLCHNIDFGIGDRILMIFFFWETEVWSNNTF